MTPPTVRITISKDEYSVLKPGLDMIANGLAAASLGSFPHRHPWHRVDLIAADVYKNQAYDQTMADALIKVRTKLCDLTSSRRIRLDFIGLSILAFALRQLPKADPSAPKADSREIVRQLSQKLEKYRKRAKRSTISAHGKQGYGDAAARWRRFSDWTQYHLLYSKVPRRGTPFLKQSWRDKNTRMAELIKVTVKERYDRVLTEAQVDRIRQLVIPSLRRGRHELTLNSVLTGSDTAKDFLIAFITKRFDLEKGPKAPLAYWENYWARTENLAEAMRRPAASGRDSAGPLHSNPADIRSSNAPVTSGIQPSIIEDKPQPSILLTDQEIIAAVGRWFTDNVDPSHRSSVCEEARHQVIRYPRQYLRPLISKSLRDLIEEARPGIESSQWCDFLNGHVEWLLVWMLALRPDLNFIFNAIGAGYVLATKPAA